MPYLSVEEIDTIAKRIITVYKKLPNLPEQPPNRVYPELLIRHILGLSIQHHVLSLDGHILGLTSSGEIAVSIYDDPVNPEYLFLNGKTLLIDKSLTDKGANRGRYHFTLIHEGCHQIYQMLFPKEYHGSIARRQIHYCKRTPSASDDYWEEWRANVLTSFILMPEDMVRNNMIAFGLGNTLPRLNRVFSQPDYDRFSEMAEYMGVSKTALSIRLKRLGLLRDDYLKNPYSLADIYPQEDEMQFLQGELSCQE